MSPVVVVATGVLMVAAGVTWLIGPWGLIVCGVAVVLAGVLIDEEALRGQPADSPPE